MLVALLVVAGVLLGIFIPLWLAATLTILLLALTVYCFILCRQGLTGQALISMIILDVILLVPMWIAYFLTNCKAGG